MATKKNTNERREKGTGTIYQRGDSWVGKIDIGVVDGKRKFKYLRRSTLVNPVLFASASINCSLFIRTSDHGFGFADGICGKLKNSVEIHFNMPHHRAKFVFHFHL